MLTSVTLVHACTRRGHRARKQLVPIRNVLGGGGEWQRSGRREGGFNHLPKLTLWRHVAQRVWSSQRLHFSSEAGCDVPIRDRGSTRPHRRTDNETSNMAKSMKPRSHPQAGGDNA